ncbi:MAG: guanylate kinase [Armatimonadetes bacterium]|nr:guanylate kinase [Armatimonadota bacterium]
MSGKLVILSGPSGVGKDTLLQQWSLRNPRVRRVCSYTTRTPRPGEQDGIDYHFVDRETFTRMIESNYFLEYKNVYENYYATPLVDMERMLEEGLIAVLKIDTAGALEAMRKRPDALTIFILPPSTEELERRIRSRGQDSPEQIEKRLSAAQAEMDEQIHYQYKVRNELIERSIDELEAIVAGVTS